jgi:histidinol dehydrogenase
MTDSASSTGTLAATLSDGATAGPAGAAPPFRLRRLDLAAAAAGDPQASAERDALIRRGAVPDAAVRDRVRATLAAVRASGDAAVRAANAAVGGGRTDGRLVLERSDLLSARDRLEPRIRRALDQAIDNVRRFAEPQLPRSTATQVAPGIEIERRWVPLARVGAYVPGGSAAYPSSLVMTAVPAMVAGVGQVVVASPADRNGGTNPILLGAAGLLEVDAFVVAGGAQAIGALAYGLPEAGLAPVDRIVGPGNAWVTAAKIEVCGEVGIDLPAGPSEGMVLAVPSASTSTPVDRRGRGDDGADAPSVDPTRIAADLITQAEHGPDSPAILVTTDAAFADAVESAVATALASADRRAILGAALREHGLIAVAPSLDAAIDFVNAYGPEHLSVDVEPLEPTVARLRNAGSVFVGPWAPESAGDYATGANHVLPTGGLARGSGGLAVETYGKFIQVQRITREGLAGIRETVGTLAEAEGLTAHRNAVEIRFRGER